MNPHLILINAVSGLQIHEGIAQNIDTYTKANLFLSRFILQS